MFNRISRYDALNLLRDVKFSADCALSAVKQDIEFRNMALKQELKRLEERASENLSVDVKLDNGFCFEYGNVDKVTVRQENGKLVMRLYREGNCATIEI